MFSVSERPGRYAGHLRAALTAAAVLTALTGLTGCGGGASSADASAVHVRPTGSPSARGWCADWQWLPAVAGLYESAYAGASRPIGASTIDADLAPGGALLTAYRRQVGEGALPARLDLGELRAFLTALAGAEATGTAPAAYAKHAAAQCQS